MELGAKLSTLSDRLRFLEHAVRVSAVRVFDRGTRTVVGLRYRAITSKTYAHKQRCFDYVADAIDDSARVGCFDVEANDKSWFRNSELFSNLNWD